MKIYLKTVIAFALLFGSASCKKILDVNQNPNKPVSVTLGVLLPAVIEATSTNHYVVASSTALFSQQLAAYASGPLNNDQNRNVRLSGAFTAIYSNTMNNVVYLIDQAKQQQAPYYEAMGKVLLAVNLGLATDIFGNIPYTEAFKGAANLSPKYDKQEVIYPIIQALLSEAITLFGQPKAALNPTTEDLIYGGNIPKWIKAANALKARFAIHLTKKGAVAAATAAMGYLPAGFAGNADDFQLTYTDRNVNPWYKNIAIGTTTGNFILSHSRKLLDGMNGTIYPGLIDPRLPLIADKKSNANYIGIINGSGGSPSGTTDITPNTFYSKPLSPIFMMTYAEQKFIEAEALFLINGGSATSTGSTPAAYAAYLAGIMAHMTKLGVPSADITLYINNPQVSVGAAALKLEHIMREKYIALYLNPEAWVDVRRYDYNPDIFKGIALPLNQDPAMNGQFIRRSNYPLEEISKNPNVLAEERPLFEKLWWDQ
ncbi:MAG: SusD/RagB family nutrient-binding outer membrane lipoprotein [Ferruginibacter sp.]